MDRLKFKKGKQNQVLSLMQRRLKLSQRKTAEILGTKRRTYKDWLSEKTTLPLSVFEKICTLLPPALDFKKDIIKKLPGNWGKSKGGKKRSKDPSFLEMLAQFRKERAKRRAKLKGKLLLEENSYITYLNNKNIDFKAILAVCLLTDGTISLKEKRMEYSTKDPILRDILFHLFYKLSKYMPYTLKDKKGVYRVRLTDATLLQQLFDLSSSYKTSPGKSRIADYCSSENQPTISFLDKCDTLTIRECIRAAFSTDGCISKNGILMLSCSHPGLCEEWRILLAKEGISTNIWKNKYSWSGILGVGTCKKENIKKFQSFGGFIRGVKISSKSKGFKGIEKNELLQQIVKYGRVA